MKKNNIKPLVMSALTAAAMVGVSVGGTFALFTDVADTKVEVEAGIVQLEQDLAIKDVYELNNQEVSASAGVYTNSIGGKTYIDSENANLLHLEKWVPGDKAVLTLTNHNLSNVTIKTRFTYSHSSTSNPDLYDALKISYAFEGGYSSGITSSNYRLWTSLEPAASVSENAFSKITITIEFPDGDNGEILYREDNKDNKYQNANCTILFAQEAVQGNAETDDILNQINFKLEDEAVLEGKNATMHDALDDLTPFLVGKIEERGYVWGITEDQFYDFASAPANAYNYFKMYEDMPTTQSYSIYAINDGWGVVNNLTVGFDAGDSGANDITYDRSSATAGRSVVIRTNSGNLTINAPLDVVKHYGNATTLNIIAIAGSSYHEYGAVPFAEISKGRIALENGANVGTVHINSIKNELSETTNVFDEIVIALADEVQAPTFSRDEVEIASSGTLVVAIQNGTEEVTEDTELDYIWLTKLGIYEQIKVSDNKESMEDAIWADDVTLDDSSTQGAAIDIANNIGRADPEDNKSEIKVELSITKDEETKTYKVVLDENRDLVVVDKADSTETPLATLDNKSNVQVGESTFEIALQSGENDVAEVVATNVNDSEEVYTAQAVAEAGLDQSGKEAAIEEAFIEELEKKGNFVAVIGLTGYETLQGALDAVNANETIKLLKDIQVSSGLVFNKNVTATLNLNNHKISNANSGINTLFTISNGDLSMINGSLENVNENQYDTIYGLAINGARASLLSGLNIKVSGTGLFMNNAAYVGELKSNIEAFFNMTNSYNSFDSMYLLGNSSINLITGGSYKSIASEETLYDYAHTSPKGYNASYPINIGSGTINKISGGDFRSVAPSSNYAFLITEGSIGEISGGYFGFADYLIGQSANLFEDFTKIGSITGGKFVSGTAVASLFDLETGSRTVEFRNAVARGNASYTVLDETFTSTVYFSTSVKEYTHKIIQVSAN